MTTVDILVTTKNNPVGLAQLLAALAVQSVRTFNLCLWDESDTSVLLVPQVVRMLDVMAARGTVSLRYARNLNSRGTPHAAGCAFRELTGSDFVWVIDDDCLPEPTALDHLVRGLIAQPTLPWIQGSFGDITNSRAHANFVAGPAPVPEPGEPAFYYYLYDDWFERTIPFGEGGNLLYRRAALLKLAENEAGYYSPNWIEAYGNQSGIHIVVSALLGRGLLNTASRVYHLERPNPRFNFKQLRNEIIKQRLTRDGRHRPASLAEIKRYLGDNDA